MDVLDVACAAGVRAVQLREKDLSPRELYELASEVKSVLDRHDASLFINDRVDIARAIVAAGVHLTANSVTPSVARRCLLPNQSIGVSTHSTEDATLAERDGADFLCFGPVYATPSKLSFGDPQGLDKLRSVAQAVSIPVIAIGGVTPERVGECLAAGAHGVAVISAILASDNVPAKVESFIRTTTDVT